jgi:putative salt-induced outer membrane protein YdiY
MSSGWKVTERPSKIPVGVAIFAVAVLTACPGWCETVTVKLHSGDVVTGELIERTPEHLVIEHPVFGRLEIPAQEISSDTLHPGIFGTKFLEGWDKDLTVGFSGSEGDTDEADLLISTSLGYTGKRQRWAIDGRYELSFADNDIDDNNARVTAIRDQLFPESRWFFFNYLAYDYDDFEAWEHRLSTGMGPGYHIIPEGKFQLDARVGPFLTYEFGDEDDARPEGGAGLYASWKIREGNTLRAWNAVFQTLDHWEQRNISRLEWKIRVTATRGLSLKFGIDNEYDSASQDSKNNFKYYSALSWDL